MGVELMVDHARELLGMPPEWVGRKLKWIGLSLSQRSAIEITGRVLNDPSTEQTILISDKDHNAWLSAWESKTGRCSVCRGEGTHVYRDRCNRCGGTGKPKETATATA